MVTAKKEGPINEVLRNIDVVEKPPIAIKPVMREILLVIDKIEKSGNQPTFSGIARAIQIEAVEEVMKQPLVKPTEAVTRFGTKLIQIEETAGESKMKLRSAIAGEELLKQLHGLVEAGYIAVRDEGEGDAKKFVFRLTSKARDHAEKLIFKLTPEAQDQIEKYEKQSGLV